MQQVIEVPTAEGGGRDVTTRTKVLRSVTAKCGDRLTGLVPSGGDRSLLISCGYFAGRWNLTRETSHEKHDLETLRISVSHFSIRRRDISSNRRVASPQYDTRQLYVELLFFKPNTGPKRRETTRPISLRRTPANMHRVVSRPLQAFVRSFRQKVLAGILL